MRSRICSAYDTHVTSSLWPERPRARDALCPANVLWRKGTEERARVSSEMGEKVKMCDCSAHRGVQREKEERKRKSGSLLQWREAGVSLVCGPKQARKSRLQPETEWRVVQSSERRAPHPLPSLRTRLWWNSPPLHWDALRLDWITVQELSSAATLRKNSELQLI